METQLNGSIALVPAKERFINFLIITGLVSLFAISLMMMDLPIAAFVSRFERLPLVMRQFMSLNFTIMADALGQLLISISMAIAALLLGGIVSLFLAFLSATNTAPSKIISVIIKGFVSTIRAIPNLVLILLIIASLGLGYVAAVASLTLSSMGYFTKAFASTIEDQDHALIETMQATGANWFQIVVHGFFPNVLPSFLAWISIRLEMSIAESISLGVIGAGGIGTMLIRSLRTHQHADVSLLILIIFTTMLSIEIVLNIFKKRANT